MTIRVLRGGDDPPFTVVRLTGSNAPDQLRSWLNANQITGTLEIEMDRSVTMPSGAVDRIADEFGLRIRIHREGGEEQPIKI